MDSKIDILNTFTIMTGKAETFEGLIRAGHTVDAVKVAYDAMERYHKQQHGGQTFTLDTTVELAKYGFNFARTSPHENEMPIVNILQKLMLESDLNRVPESFKRYQRDKEINNL